MKYLIIYNSNLLFITLLISNLLSKDFKLINETLNYSISFRNIPAGEAQINFYSDTLNGSSVMHLKSLIKTNSFIDNFYIVRDEIDAWLDIDDLSLKKIIKKTHQGKYKKHSNTLILGDSLAVYNGSKINISNKVYDPISIIYYIRKKNLDLITNDSLICYENGKVRELLFDVVDKKLIDVEFLGKIECIKIVPRSNTDKPLLKNDGEMEFWFTLDQFKLPVIIVQKTNLGEMTMKLKTIKNNHF
tara:strand:+ start:2202 stop:2936 length:735 start_codon:yes stop_codon:yes gene_type:complete